MSTDTMTFTRVAQTRLRIETAWRACGAAMLFACVWPAAAQTTDWAANPPNPDAPYPGESRLNGEQGTVLLRVQTTPSGKPTIVEVKQSSGYARLDKSAIETVWKWQFKPTPDDGTVIWREVPIRFFITSGPPVPDAPMR